MRNINKIFSYFSVLKNTFEKIQFVELLLTSKKFFFGLVKCSVIDPCENFLRILLRENNHGEEGDEVIHLLEEEHEGLSELLRLLTEAGELSVKLQAKSLSFVEARQLILMEKHKLVELPFKTSVTMLRDNLIGSFLNRFPLDEAFDFSLSTWQISYPPRRVKHRFTQIAAKIGSFNDFEERVDRFLKC